MTIMGKQKSYPHKPQALTTPMMFSHFYSGNKSEFFFPKLKTHLKEVVVNYTINIINHT